MKTPRAIVCQDCYADIRPDNYFPMVETHDICVACGAQAFVARVRWDEVLDIATPPVLDQFGNPSTYTLWMLGN